MTEALPWLLLVAALVAIPLARSKEPSSPAKPLSLVGPVVFGLLALALAFGTGAADGVRNATLALALALVVARGLALAPASLALGGNQAFAYGIGGALVALGGLWADGGPFVAVGLAAGLALGAARVWTWLGLGGASVALVNGLGAKSEIGAASSLGTALAFAIVLAWVLRSLLAGRGQSWLPGVAGAALAAVGACLAANQYVVIADGLVLVAVAVVCAVVARAASLGSASSFASILCAVVWLAGASIAFGLARGLGMSVLFAVGLALSGLLGESRRLAALGPLGGLVVYRLFREHFTEASRSLDIGQHYAIVGLVAAMLVPLAVAQWRAMAKGHETPQAALGEGALLGLSMASLATGIVLLAAKGAVGMLVGFGIAPIAAMLSDQEPEETHSLALGWGLLALPTFAALDAMFDLSRDDKVQFLVKASVALIALAIALTFLTPKNTQETP